MRIRALAALLMLIPHAVAAADPGTATGTFKSRATLLEVSGAVAFRSRSFLDQGDALIVAVSYVRLNAGAIANCIGCGYCTGENTSTVALSNGKLSGKLKDAENERSFDITLVTPAMSDDHGTALPADGGAPGSAYRAYHAALVKEGDAWRADDEITEPVP